MTDDTRLALFVGGVLAGIGVGLYLREKPAEAGGLEPPAGPRNARRTSWRSPIDKNGGWAAWVRELAGRHGVYLIRDLETKELLYVGESHRGRLLPTLRRHLWSWSGRGAGPTYDPQRVQIAIELYDQPDDAVDRQFELIRSLQPRDNVVDGHSLLPPLEEVPF
jgi:hypothetical protein